MLVIGLLTAGIIKADWLTGLAEEGLFSNDIIYTRETSYQRIVVTQSTAGFQLFLNGNLQFASVDEYRYHEALVHPLFSSVATTPKRVLVLGGGDGLAVREILKHPGVQAVTLVDIDPEMTRLAMEFPRLAELNGHALADPRVAIVNQDALIWLDAPGEKFDAAIIDFPDPSSFSLGKLYTTRFYRLLRERLATDAVVAIQCTSAWAAPKSFWCVVRTLEAAGFNVLPYHAAVPSFNGVWGFVLASTAKIEPPQSLSGHLAGKLRYLNNAALANLFELPLDMQPRPVEINRLNNQTLVRYYEEEWAKWK